MRLVEVEVFIANDRAVSIVDDVVGVVSNIVGRLEVVVGTVGSLDVRAIEDVVRPLVFGRLRSRVPAGDTGRVGFKRVEAFESETFGGVYALTDGDLSAQSFYYFNVDGSHHCLTCELVESCLSVIEHIPLAVDLTDAAVGVAVGGSSRDCVALLVDVASAAVDDGSAIGPRSQRMIAVRIGKRVVRHRKTELAVLREAAVDEDILILDLADGGRLEEAKVTFLITARHHILDHLRAGFHRRHRGRIKLGGIRPLESPVAIDAPVVVNKHGRVELQHTIRLVRVVGTPVADLKRSVGAAALGDESVAATCLVVGEQIIGLGAVGGNHQCDIRRIEHVGGAGGVERLTFRILVDGENHTIVAPVAEVVDVGRPNHLIAAAVFSDEVVVRAVDVDTILSRIIRIFEDIRFTIGNMLPKWQVGVSRCLHNRLCVGCCVAGCKESTKDTEEQEGKILSHS